MAPVRRMLRRLTRRLRGAPFRLVYHPGYGVPTPGLPMDARRAEKILAFLTDEGLLGRRDLLRPRPASLEAVLRVHAEAYVASLDQVEAVSAALGTPVTDEQRQAMVDLQRLHAGGTVLAVRTALRTGGLVVNLGGGFHHATPDQGMGFCLLNDVAIAVAHCRHYGFDGRVLVVDLDLHDGNGTRAAFAADPDVFTLSIHNQDWEPAGGVATRSVALGTGVDDATFLETLERELPEVLAAHRPALVIYVAGVDPAADDRLGDWRLTPAGLLARDRAVLERVRGPGGEIPVAVTLAGGYGRNAWRYTARLLAWLVTGRVLDPPDELAQVVRKVRALAGPDVLGDPAADDWGLTEADLFAVAPGSARGTRVLGTVSKHAVELSLERTGLLEAVRRRGFRAPQVVLDTASGVGDTIRLYGDAERRELLMELRVSRSRQVLPGCDLLYVEWLRLQNPRATFDARHPRLPGQEHPGLGLLREVVAWLVVVCERFGLDGIAFTPAEFYMAVLGRHHMRFLDPAAQARFEALSEAVRGLPLEEAAGAVAAGRVRDVAGAPVHWEPAVQVYPVSERMAGVVAARAAGDVPRPRYVLAPPAPGAVTAPPAAAE